MAYIERLRKIIGHDPIISGAATAVIVNDKKEILFEHRSDDGKWCLPGGAMELGESLEDTLKREIYEETGLKILEYAFLHLYSGDSEHVIYPNQDDVYYINALYYVSKYEGNLTIMDGESLELKFFSVENIPKDLTKSCRNIMKDIDSYLKVSD